MSNLFILEEQPRPEPVRWELSLVRKVTKTRYTYNGLQGQAGAHQEQYEATETKPVTLSDLREILLRLSPEERAEVCRES